MEALEIARIYANRIAEQEMVAHKAAIEGPKDKVSHWIARILDCKTLEDFRAVLSEFSAMNCWSLTDRAQVSAHYTPKVMKLVTALDDIEKWKYLEDLEDLCWNRKYQKWVDLWT